MPEAGVMGDDAMAASPGDAQDALSGEGVLGGAGEASGGTGQAPSHSYLGIQIHNRYLVTQDECGMVVIDQHALHERVMYERIRAKVIDGGGRLETQRLLVPEPVSLTPAERSAVLDARECLGRVGIEIDDFGGDTILISGYPTMLAKSAPGEVLRQALESILGFGRDPEPRDLLDHLLHSMACKAAVKAGDRLSSEEITALLEQRHLYQDTHHCPHGRPTALFFSRDELDKMFGRLGPQANKSFSGQKRPS
jgi:DNA mismatch repair protein MutL